MIRDVGGVRVRFTHKGWFGCCPVYLAEDGPSGMHVLPRHWSLAPVFAISEWWEQARIFISSWLWLDYEPQFMFKVTGKLP